MSLDTLYINTQLNESVTLHPSLLNNELYLNLKNKLIEDYEDKCIRNYGYITKIYEICNYKNCIIQTNNPLCSATFKIKYNCRLCVPLKNKIIVCEVVSMNKHLITLKNGPLKVVVTLNRINTDIFEKDNSNNIIFKYKNGVKQLLKGDFVKIRIVTVLFNHGDKCIKSIGFMDSTANEKEIEHYLKSQYNKDEKYLDYKEHLEKNGIIEVKKETKKVSSSPIIELGPFKGKNSLKKNKSINISNNEVVQLINNITKRIDETEEQEQITDAIQSTIVANNNEFKKKKKGKKKKIKIK